MAAANKLNSDVLDTLARTAREIIRKGGLDFGDATMRDWEILSEARVCDKCNAVYSIGLVASDKECPNCDKPDEFSDRIKDMQSIKDDIETAASNLDDIINEIKKAKK